MEGPSLEPQQDPYRLGFHLSPPVGWMNDPNGLVHHGGWYHAFYQHHPASTDWGPMHWAHARSADLVTWEHLPIALYPDETEEGGGCFSGSAVSLPDGRLALIYTSHVDAREPKEAQAVAFSTDSGALCFRKHRRNPVVVPPHAGCADFRDPKVWRHGELWYMVVGTTCGGVGDVLLFSSVDLAVWAPVGSLLGSRRAGMAAPFPGTMCECPDLFRLGGKDVLLFSPMGLPGHKSIYVVGKLDYTTGAFHADHWDEIDHGGDFYAAQTLEAPDGRRILIAWMRMWGQPAPESAHGWSGALTLPRALSLNDAGKLVQAPVAELERFRREITTARPLTVGPAGAEGGRGAEGAAGELALPSTGERFDLEVTVDLTASTATRLGLSLRCSPEGADVAEATVLSYDRDSGTLCLDRARSGLGASAPQAQCMAPLSEPTSGQLRLRVIGDTSSIEVFAQDGEQCLTARVYPNPTSTGLSMWCRGGSATLSLSLNSLDI